MYCEASEGITVDTAVYAVLAEGGREWMGK